MENSKNLIKIFNWLERPITLRVGLIKNQPQFLFLDKFYKHLVNKKKEFKKFNNILIKCSSLLKN